MPDLPSVEQKFIADALDYLAALDAMIAKSEEFAAAAKEAEEACAAMALAAEDAATVIDAAMGTATHAVDELRDAFVEASAAAQGLKGAGGDTGLGAAAGEAAVLSHQLDEVTDSLAAQLALLGSIDAAFAALRGDISDISGSLALQAALLTDIRDKLAEAALASAAMAAAQRGAADATGDTAVRTRILGRGLFGIIGALVANVGAWTAFHYIVMSVGDFLAVAIPASIATASAALVAYQGVVEQTGAQLMSLYTATEATASMIGRTSGDVLGLGHSFQTAQDMADGLAKELLGSYITAASSHLTNLAAAGTTVYQAFAKLSAEVDLDLKGSLGTTLGNMLQKGAGLAIEFGQVLGNLGHAFLNLASDLPGTADLILKIIDGFSRAILWVSKLPSGLLQLALAFEAVYRIGIPVIGLLGRMTMGLGRMLPETSAAGDEMVAFGGALQVVPGPLKLVIAAAGALAIYLAKSKSPADQLISSINGLVQAASNVQSLQVLTNSLGKVDGQLRVLRSSFNQSVAGTRTWDFQLSQAAASTGNLSGLVGVLTQNSHQWGVVVANTSQYTGGLTGALTEASIRLTNFGGSLGAVSVGLQHMGSSIGGIAGFFASFTGATTAAEEVRNLTSEQQRLVNETESVIRGGAAVSKQFGVSFVTALGLADAAGVKLDTTLPKFGKNLNAAGQQIDNVILGYEKMGQSGSILSNDMAALTIQAAVQNSKVSGLNQAWDSFLSNVTGLTGGFAGLQTSIASIASSVTGATNATNKFGVATSSGISGAATALSSFRASSATVWSAYDSALQQAGTYIDNLRIASVYGGLSQKAFAGQVAYAAAQLLPYAAKSKTATEQLSALAQQAGGPATSNFKTLKQWIDSNKMSAQQFAKAMQDETGKMADAAAAAQQFAGTLQSQVSTALANASLQALGLDTKASKMAQDIHSGAYQAAQAVGQQLYSAFIHAGLSSQTAKTLIYDSMRAAGASVQEAKRIVATFKAQWDSIHSKSIQLNVDIAQHGGVSLPGGGGDRITVPGGAKGFDSAPRGLAMVGEEGPELMVMRGGEHVIPAHHTAAIMKLAGSIHRIPGYASGTPGIAAAAAGSGGGSSGKLESQLMRELAKLVQHILGASSMSGVSQYIKTLESTIKQLISSRKLGKDEETKLTHLIDKDNKRLDALFKQRQKIVNEIKKYDQTVTNVSQNAQSTASLSSIMSGAGSGPVSSSYILAMMRQDLAGIKKFDADIKKLAKMGLDKALLNQIIAMGPVQGDQVAQALINGPMANIAALNKTESQVQQASHNLGKTAATLKYGPLGALKTHERELDKEMRHLGDTLVQEIRRQLHLPGLHHEHHASGTGTLHGAVRKGVEDGLRTSVPYLASSLRGAAGEGTALRITMPVELKLDSKTVWKSVQTETLRVNRRNPDNRLSLTRGRG